jgi:TonB-dependent receptor
VVDAIVADDIGKFPDTTVAAALQRVPGVQVVNGFNNEIVSPLVRGIGDILTTLDGREMFTGVGRGFAFQDLPAEALAGADVYKSNSANLLEGGVAGVINLKLQKPFNFKKGLSGALNIRGTYGENAEKANYTVGGLISGRWDLGDGEIGALLNISYSDQKFNRPISFNCDPRSATNGPPGAAGIVLPTCVGGLTDTGGYQRPQANAAIQWRPTPELEFYLDGLYSGYRSRFGTFFVFSDIFGAQSITNAVAGDDCFTSRVDPGGFPGREPNPNATPPFAGDGFQDLCLGRSATFNNVAGLTSTQSKRDKTDQYLGAGGFRYNGERWHVDMDVSYFKSRFQARTLIVDIGKQIPTVNIVIDEDGHGTTDMPGNPLGDPSDFRFANGLFQDINTSDSALFAWKADFAYDVDSFINQLQAGFRYGKRTVEFDGFAGGPPAPGGNRMTLVDSVGLPSNFLIPSPASIPYINGGAPWMTPDPDAIRNNIDRIRAIYGAPAGDPANDPSRSYDATESTMAMYAQAKYLLELGGDVLVDGLVGFRYVLNDRRIAGTGLVTPPAPPGGPTPPAVLTPIERGTSEGDFLPNASIRVRLSPELQLRASYAKTLSRPAFGDLNPGLFYEIPNNANIQPNGRGGNPDLRSQKSDAFDATVEYYFGRTSYVAAAVYYRTITDRVALGVEDEVIDGITYNITRPRNLGGSKLKGIELSGQVFFDFLPDGLDGLGAFGNFTLADSEITTPDDPLEGEPLLGVSKYSYNVGALYEKYGITARAVYSWRDKYNEVLFAQGLLVPGDEAKFNSVKANGRLDFSVSYDITPNLSISADGVNVLGSDYHSYFHTEAFPHDIRLDDTFYGASIRAKF